MKAEGPCRRSFMLVISLLSLVSRAPMTFGLGCLLFFGHAIYNQARKLIFMGTHSNLRCLAVAMHRETIVIIDTSRKQVDCRNRPHEAQTTEALDVERGEICVQVVVGDFGQVY